MTPKLPKLEFQTKDFKELTVSELYEHAKDFVDFQDLCNQYGQKLKTLLEFLEKLRNTGTLHK